MDFNEYMGSYYVSKYERKLMYEDNKQKLKEQKDEYFNSDDPELNDVWEDRKKVCFHRFHRNCEYKNCLDCKSFFPSKEHDNELLRRVLKAFQDMYVDGNMDYKTIGIIQETMERFKV